METPIYDFLRRYDGAGMARFHMPGHKGKEFLGCEHLDITEVKGADALYEAEGIIAQSEANATALFGSRRTCYSTEGSSQCIRAMMYLALTCRPTGAALFRAVCLRFLCGNPPGYISANLPFADLPLLRKDQIVQVPCSIPRQHWFFLLWISG